MAGENKARYWWSVCYPENMIDNWEDVICHILQLPFSYCIHDHCSTESKENRKVHVHIIIAFPNTTTYKNALSIFQSLSKNADVPCCNKCERIISIRYAYDYLIHDTDNARKAGKYLYQKEKRITGNLFDIGAYEQIGIKEKHEMVVDLCNIIIEHCIYNFADFYCFVLSEKEECYREILFGYCSLFEKLTKANYQKLFLFDKDSKPASNDFKSLR